MPLLGEAQSRPTYDLIARVVDEPDRLVYQAFHRLFDGPCWQKTVPLQGLPDAMFLTEPQLVEALDHPNIVQVREAQFDPQIPNAITFVMRHYEGGSVDDALRAGHRFSVNEAVTLARQLLDALSYLHVDIGFVHRDVKPHNLLLDSSRTTAYLSDFGSAARIGADGTVNAAGFTTAYLDPAAATSGRMTTPSDLYAAGLTLLELLSDKPLIDARFDPAKAEARLVDGRCAFPPSTLVYAAHVPTRLRRIVNKMMRPGADERYASVADAATALNRLKLIDWRHAEGDGLDGTWTGTWPPNKPKSKRRELRVESALLTSGRNRGQRRLLAQWRTAKRDWRGVAGGSTTCAAEDGRAVRQFFSDVSDNVTHSKAAS